MLTNYYYECHCQGVENNTVKQHKDERLLADGQTVGFVFEDGELVSVHLSKRRLTPDAVEELYFRTLEVEAPEND